MPTVKANQTAIENLPPPDAKRFERYEVDGVDGLWVVVRQNGKRSFYARYQFTRNGKREFFEKKLGDVSTVKLAAARERAKELVSHAQLKREDPLAKTDIDQRTFGDLFELWLKHYAKANRKTRMNDEGVYNRYLKAPAAKSPKMPGYYQQPLSAERLATLDRKRILAVLDSVAEGVSGLTSNRCHTLISTVLTWGFREELGPRSPLEGIKKRFKEADRTRVLTDFELRTLWHADLHPQILAVVRLLMLTGQREGEVCGIHAGELDGDQWVMPPWRTKNGKEHAVPLPAMAMQLAQQLVEHGAPHAKTVSHVPNKFRGKPDQDGHSQRCECVRLQKQCWTIHDLRRTCKTRWVAKPLSIGEGLSDRITNHTDGRSIGSIVYNKHEYLSERMAALTTWQTELLRIVGG